MKKIRKIRKVASEHTWDVTTTDEQYILSNGCISHNTSSQISNATNGIEPPRGLVSVKTSKEGILKQVVPDIKNTTYELLWNIPNNRGYLTLVGIMQKFVDQTISANTNYDPSKYSTGLVPLQEIISDILYAYSIGVKTLYYHNTRDGASDDLVEQPLDTASECESGACKL